MSENKDKNIERIGMKTTTEETIQFLDQLSRMLSKYRDHLIEMASPSGDVPDDWDFIHGVAPMRPPTVQEGKNA